MIFKKTKIDGVIIAEPEAKVDERGYFEVIYGHDKFREQNIDLKIVQVNRSLSLRKGTIRGVHMQLPPVSEDKFVQCIKGSVFDVAVDLRKDSKTFGKWVGNILSAKNKEMMLIPKEFGHGIQALEDNSIIEYSVSEYYSPEHILGIRWDDPFFKIKWPIIKNVVLSEADKSWPLFSDEK